MATKLHGVYNTAHEARESVEYLKKQGMRPSNLSIVLNDKARGTILSEETDTNIQVEDHQQPNKEKHRFMDNIKESFSGASEDIEPEGHTKATLIRLGLSEEEALLYIEDIDSGNIVVLIHADSPYTAKDRG
ncbi:heat induced stress protein YflT [Sinobaca qinghaiensis]|uniref:Heat induced stress protein YflT n=1 Tax=Sinobaca qinghaiensis TaxID=342944 RepID=A0A419UWX7_9BACL|nr:general stress protein [Sinobaca qinghaiensis]RKD69631.1 heat induced stress protein YflT [Sinobaca qinghaiensis]